MKQLFFIVCAALLSMTICVVDAAPKSKIQKFSVQGKIDGLHKSDTLSFQRITILGFKLNAGFDIVLKDDSGQFSHKGTQEHTWMYILVYKPAAGQAPKADRMGRQILIAHNDKITLSGTRQFTAFCNIAGGAYNNPILQEALNIEDSLGMIRTGFLQKSHEAYQAKDTVNAKKYEDAFNSFRGGQASQRARQLMNEYYSSPTTSELAATSLLKQSSFTPVEELDAAWVKLPTSVQQSYYGKLLEQRIKAVRSLTPGQQAPYFTLTNGDGRAVSLSDFKGQYLLVYHWGMCAGSMQIDPAVKELYDGTDRQQLSIIGVSSSIDVVKSLRSKASATDSLKGMNLAEHLDCMLSHPYPDFDLNVKGNDISDIYMFGGLPFFVFISPEGKIIARGFREVFNEAYVQLMPQK